MPGWIAHFLGIDSPTGRWYGFWSGFGSDLGEFAIVAGLVAMVRRHNCHVKGCWRLAWRIVEGTPHEVCRKHHLDDPPTHAQVILDHKHYRERLTRIAGRREKG